MSDALEHEACEALIPAYALAATDDAERRNVEAHLAACAACRDLLSGYRRMEEDLVFAVAPIAAPFRLSEDISRRMGRAPVPLRRRRRGPLRVSLSRPALIFGLVALALLLVTNVFWAYRWGRIEREMQVLAAIVEAPGIPLTGEAAGVDSRGVIFLPEGATRGLLCVYDLPALPADQAYQAWLVRDGQRTSAGTFRVNPEGYGVLLMRADEPLNEFDGVGITVEPAGGSPAPTTPRVMGGAL